MTPKTPTVTLRRGRRNAGASVLVALPGRSLLVAALDALVQPLAAHEIAHGLALVDDLAFPLHRLLPRGAESLTGGVGVLRGLTLGEMLQILVANLADDLLHRRPAGPLLRALHEVTVSTGGAPEVAQRRQGAGPLLRQVVGSLLFLFLVLLVGHRSSPLSLGPLPAKALLALLGVFPARIRAGEPYAR